MREIKFRVYDGNQWSYFTIGQPMTPWMQSVYHDHCLNGRDFLQFTGMKDKNERDIFEGDIVKTYQVDQGDLVQTVLFDRGSFWVDHPMNFFCELRGFKTDYIEVIGNIYENGHLLK